MWPGCNNLPLNKFGLANMPVIANHQETGSSTIVRDALYPVRKKACMLPTPYDMDGKLRQAKLEETRLETTSEGIQTYVVADVEMLHLCTHGDATDNAEEHMVHAIAATVCTSCRNCNWWKH